MKRRYFLVEQRFETIYGDTSSMHETFYVRTPEEAATMMVKSKSRFDLGATIVYERVASFTPSLELKLIERT